MNGCTVVVPMNWFAVLAALLLAGCPRKTMTDDERKQLYADGMKPVLAQHQAPVTATLEGLKTIPTAAAAEPPVTAPQPLPAPAACSSDTCLIKTAEPIGPISIDAGPTTVDWKIVPRILRGEYAEYSVWQADERTLKTVAAISHLAVVRVHAFEKPLVGTNVERYTGGRASGDVIVYDVKSKQRLGGFPWAVEMPDTVRVDASTKDPTGAYEYALVNHATNEIRSAIASFYAGKVTAPEAPKDDAQLRERQISEILAGQKMPVNGVEITDAPACKVVLITAIPHLLAAKPGTDGAVKPEASEAVRKVMNKDCAVSYREP